MLRQRDLDRSVAEMQGFTALGDDDLSFRGTKLLGHLRRDWCPDHGRAGLLGNRSNVGDMIEMRVRDKYRFGLRHVGRLETEIMAPRRTVEIGIKQIDLAFVGKFKIGVAEPTDDDSIGLRRRQRPARHGGRETLHTHPDYRRPARGRTGSKSRLQSRTAIEICPSIPPLPSRSSKRVRGASVRAAFQCVEMPP